MQGRTEGRGVHSPGTLGVVRPLVVAFWGAPPPPPNKGGEEDADAWFAPPPTSGEGKPGGGCGEGDLAGVGAGA